MENSTALTARALTFLPFEALVEALAAAAWDADPFAGTDEVTERVERELRAAGRMFGQWTVGSMVTALRERYTAAVLAPEQAAAPELAGALLALAESEAAVKAAPARDDFPPEGWDGELDRAHRAARRCECA